jgi:hypothetical protein
MSTPILAMIPSGKKAAKLYSVLPTDGTGDFTVARNTVVERTNASGANETVAVDVPILDYKDTFVPATDISAYSFNGTSDYVTLPTIPAFGTGDFSVVFKGIINAGTSYSFLVGGAANCFNMYIDESISKVNIELGGGATIGTSTSTITRGIETTIIYKRTSGQGLIIIEGVDAGTFADTTDYSVKSSILGSYNGSQYFLNGSISMCRIFNYALTPTQVVNYSNNAYAIEAIDKGYNGVLTSGALISGKIYRINTFVAGDDFTNIGGTNVTGNVFTATGTTPTTWTNASSVVLLGSVLDLNLGKTATYWYDLIRLNKGKGTVITPTLSNSTFGTDNNALSTCPILKTEPACTQHFKTSSAPATQTISTLTIGTTYTLSSMKGEGVATMEEVTGGLGGAMTEVYPLTWVASDTTVVITLSAGHTFEDMNLTDTTYAVNHIVNAGVGTISRVVDDVTRTTAGLGLTSITETIDGVAQTPVTVIPATYTISTGNINKVIGL